MGTRSTRAGIGAAAASALIAATALLVGVEAAAAAPGLEARGSAEQVQVTGATPGAKVKLRRDGSTVATRRGGELGGVVFRKVDPGRGYTVSTDGVETRPIRVFSNRGKPPSTDVYDQAIGDGYGYLTTRDGTELG